MKKFLVIFLCLLLITGCGDNGEMGSNEIVNEVVIQNKDAGVLIVTEDKKITNESVVKVENILEDYTKLNEDIERAKAFDIEIFNNDEEVTITSEIEIMLEIPSDYNKDMLVVYYVDNNEIKETFNVEVINKDGIDYASFKTSHLSIYVLAELKEMEKEEDKNVEKSEDEEVTKEENKVTKEDNKTNTTTSSGNSNNNQSSSNNSSSLKTIDLVGAWKVDGDKTIMVYNSDYTGQLIHYVSEEPIFVPFVWSMNGVSLYVAYQKGGYGSSTSDIIIVDKDTFKLRNDITYRRYYGEVPKEVVKVYYTGSYTIDVEIRNIPSNLQVTKNNYTATYKFRTEDKEVYDRAINHNASGFIDASQCTTPGVYTLNINLINTPRDIEYLDGVSALKIEFVEKYDLWIM